jgi:hypothetical protein
MTKPRAEALAAVDPPEVAGHVALEPGSERTGTLPSALAATGEHGTTVPHLVGDVGHAVDRFSLFRPRATLTSRRGITCRALGSQCTLGSSLPRLLLRMPGELAFRNGSTKIGVAIRLPGKQQ